MKRHLLALFLTAFVVPVFSQDTPPRTALVMGVGDYGGAKFKGGTIPNLPGITTADLPSMEAKLKSLGFNVTLVTNPTLSEAKQAVDAFSARIKATPGVSLFYFSGHGGEYEGKNYLIPRGANIGSKADLSDEALSAQRVLNGMEESGAQVNLVFLDCCRQDLGKSVGGAEMAPLKAKGSFIGFATRSGDFADPGEEGSPYTRFLLKHLDKPGLSVADMYSLVIGEVMDFSKRALGEERRPGFYSELDAPFYLVPVKLTPGSPAATPAMSEAEIERRARELAVKMAAVAAMRNTTAPSIPSASQLPAAGKSFTNSLGMKFVLVPGTQVMMCIHETRNADYAAYAAAQSGVVRYWRSGSGTEQYPVVDVSYNDADAFCSWLSAKEGKTYRVPTDAEWSAAVGLQNERGATPKDKSDHGSEDVFPWGNYYPPKSGDGNYLPKAVDDGYEGIAPVMSFRANNLGIYDLGGNVFEFCQGWYDNSQEYRVLRGASFIGIYRSRLCSSSRLSVIPTNRDGDRGFRCVLEASVAATSEMPRVIAIPPVPPSSPAAPAPAVNSLLGVRKEAPYQNSLGMAFVPAGTPGVLFSVWETRVRDFEAFVEDSGHDAIGDNSFGTPAYTLEKTADGKDAEWAQKGGSWQNPRFPSKQTGEHPVVCVSYLDAEAFCAWLTKKDRASGKIPATASYRLPSDAEWSRACGSSEFPWGDSYPPKSSDGNYSGKEAMVGVYEGFSNELVEAGYLDSAARTAAVGMFGENRFGLYDMGGNVFEWCSTWYTADLNDAETLKAMPVLKNDRGGQTYRVLRGSSWYGFDRVNLRSSARYIAPPTIRNDHYGFRCVLVVAGG